MNHKPMARQFTRRDAGAIENSPLPGGFLRRMESALGDEFPAFLASYEQPVPRALRLRPGADAALFADILSAPVPWAENAFYLRADAAPGAHPLHEAGAYYLQDASAMAPAAALHPLPGETVLDLCAAPGGKATQLAALMRGQGCLVANEPHPGRARILGRNIERMGIAHAAVTACLPEKLAEKWPGRFDRILVDAPCSGEGMFRKDPAARLEWTEDSPARCAKRQLAILDSAARMLKPGGRLAYSTCTFNTAENEGVVRQFLLSHPGFCLAPFALPGLSAAPEGVLRLWPHRLPGEGHFVALMEKRGSLEPPAPSRPTAPFPPFDEEGLCRAQLSAVTPFSPRAVALFKGAAVCPPDTALPFEGIPLLRLGLHLGTLKGARLVPDHALALHARAHLQLPVDEQSARAYLHGEALPAGDTLSGWAAPTLRGFALGWGKASDGQLKNHYPKGLRK